MLKLTRPSVFLWALVAVFIGIVCVPLLWSPTTKVTPDKKTRRQLKELQHTLLWLEKTNCIPIEQQMEQMHVASPQLRLESLLINNASRLNMDQTFIRTFLCRDAWGTRFNIESKTNIPYDNGVSALLNSSLNVVVWSSGRTGAMSGEEVMMSFFHPIQNNRRQPIAGDVPAFYAAKSALHVSIYIITVQSGQPVVIEAYYPISGIQIASTTWTQNSQQSPPTIMSQMEDRTVVAGSSPTLNVDVPGPARSIVGGGITRVLPRRLHSAIPATPSRTSKPTNPALIL